MASHSPATRGKKVPIEAQAVGVQDRDGKADIRWGRKEKIRTA